MVMQLASLWLGGYVAGDAPPTARFGLIFALIVATALWAVYGALPLGVFPCLRDFDQFTDVKLGASADVTETEGDTANIRYDAVQATKHYPIERYECPAAKQGKTTDELCAGAFRGRVQSDEFIELANLTLGGDGAQEAAELEYKVANEKGSAKLLGEQSI